MNAGRWALLLAAAATASAEPLDAVFAAHGRLLVTQFLTAPFPHPSRAHGHQYREKFFPADPHYCDRTVAVFIPRDFRPGRSVDCVFHFHGWYNSVAGTLRQFQLIEQLVESRRQALLVVPAGPRDAPDSAGGRLEEPDGFKRFVAELRGVLRQHADFQPNDPPLGRIILSAHSGGYRVVAAILDRGGLADQVQEVWLFDALYAETPKFLAWWERNRGRLLNIYTDRGGTKDDTEQMMATLRERGLPFLARQDTEVTPEELRAHRLIFLHTDLDHNDVLAKRRTFRRFLETSCLAAAVAEEPRRTPRSPPRSPP